MVLTRCAFCTHSNPTGARFCNECGSPLHLWPCEHCEAVNDVLSRECYRCGAPLRRERALTPIAAPAHAEALDTSREWALTTVEAAYGDGPPESTRWGEAARAVDRATTRAWLAPTSDPPIQEEPGAERQDPFVDALADGDDAHRPLAQRARRGVRTFAIAMATLAVVALAALGSYTFTQRGEVREPAATTTEPVAPAPIDAPATSVGEPSAPPAASTSDSAPPSSAVSPSAPPDRATTTPAQEASTTATDATGDATPDDRAARRDGARAVTPRTERKTTTAPKASQDAVETQRIITRELGGFGPPPSSTTR